MFSVSVGWEERRRREGALPNVMPTDLLWTWDVIAKLDKWFTEIQHNSLLQWDMKTIIAALPISHSPWSYSFYLDTSLQSMCMDMSSLSRRSLTCHLHHSQWPASFIHCEMIATLTRDIYLSAARRGWCISFVWKHLMAAYIKAIWQHSCRVLETNYQFYSIIHRITSDLQQ